MEIPSEVLVSCVGVISSVLTLSLSKFFTRKTDKVDLQEKQMNLTYRMAVNMEERFNTYIGITERAIKDIAILQERLSKIYPFTCVKSDCQERQLLNSDEFSACVTINDKPNSDTT